MIAIFVVKIFAFEILEVNALLHCTVDPEPTTCVYHLRSQNITCGGGKSISGDSGITCDTDVTRGWYNLTPGVYRYREYSN